MQVCDHRRATSIRFQRRQEREPFKFPSRWLAALKFQTQPTMLSIHTTSNYATRAFPYIFETNVQSMTSHNRLTIYNTNHSTTTIFTDLFSTYNATRYSIHNNRYLLQLEFGQLLCSQISEFKTFKETVKKLKEQKEQ